LDRETATTRMLRRGRADDTTSSIWSRLQQFYDKTIPMIELCQTHFPITQIDANDTIENIHAQVMKVVG
jgi:adenylate kinase family enzyme